MLCVVVARTIVSSCQQLTFLLNVFGVGVSCHILYSFVVYLYVSRSVSNTSVGEESANLSAAAYS